MIIPRAYQEAAIESIYNYFISNNGNPLIGLPTGTGKSLIPAVFIERTMKHWPNQRFLLLTHVKELIEQNAEVLKLVWPNAPLGVYSAGLKSKQPYMPIVFAGIQSAIKNPMAFGHRDLIWIDEAHLVSEKESSSYQTFISYMKSINPHLKIIGMTATLYRMGLGTLIDNGLFTDVAFDLTGIEGFNRLLADGYMSPLIPLRTKTELDVSNVGVQKNEFIASQLQAAVDKQEITFAGLREAVDAGQNRGSWLIFASGIEHAEHIAEMLGTFGIDCAAVHSKKPAAFNDKAIAAFKNGTLRAISCFSKLTTGFNHPGIDMILDFRPTLSIPLHVQKYGRGTRPAEGKENCIAEGSLVLTDIGLIPIEKITLKMKLWDGIEFVSHTGIIYNGYKEVIEYEGLEATPDHLVSTEKGWKTFRESRKKRIGIKITAIGRKPIREIENIFSRNTISKKNLYSSSMYGLQYNCIQIIYKCYEIGSWLSNLWQTYKIPKSSSKVALQKMFGSQKSLQQFKRYSLQGLWWSRYTIQFQECYGYGYLGNGQFGTSEKYGFRSKIQQWTLRNWKFKMVNENTKYEKSKVIKKHVFDITNAGRYNRFTVNGMLVHNCLALDFARNVPRLGPINDPIIPRKKGEKMGDPPVKICDACGAYNHASVRFCAACGNEFEFKIKIVAKPGTDAILRSDLPVIETYDVDRVIYSPHDKIGSPQSLKVTYFCGMQSFRQFICLEHGGLAGHKAREWWRQRHRVEPPKTIKEALNYLSELRTPRLIRVWVNKRYPEITGQEF